MEKKLTYQDILNAFDAFANDLANAKLGWVISLYISRNIDFLKSHVDHYNKANDELVETHSVKKETEDGIRQVIPPDKVAQFREETQELLDKEVEIEYDSIRFESLDEKTQEKVNEFITSKIIYGIKYTFEE